MAFFEATLDLDFGISEVDFLIDSAAGSHDNADVQNIFIKISVILLTAKLETFVENILEEFTKKFSETAFRAKILPTEIKKQSTTYLLKDLLASGIFSGKIDAVAALAKASALWDDEVTINDLTINCRFNYGKHGSKEIISLFKRIGIIDICEVCKITIEEEDSLVETSKKRLAITADLVSCPIN